VRVKADVLDMIVRHARIMAPNECCGVLIGEADAVEEAVPARNIAEQPSTRFLIDPKDHLDALRTARGRGRDVIGFYHSHPRSTASPSATDLAEASYPDHLFIIVGLREEPPDIRVFRFTAGNFIATAYVTVP
jgi:proteasome lid subunit RPN8/RPN11